MVDEYEGKRKETSASREILNKNVGSFTFNWELIIKENLLRGLISRLYLDIDAGVRQERELFRSCTC